MKSCRWISLVALLCLATPPRASAQDTAARAAAIAERDAAEERYRRLSSGLEDLWAAKTEQDRRINALAEELRGLRADLAKADHSKYVSRDELKRLADSVQEIDEKRLADRKLIEEKFAELRGDIRKALAAPPATTSRKPRATPAPEAAEENPAAAPANPGAQEGVWYTIESGNTLAGIAKAHNDAFQPQGRKTSVKLIQDANAGLKPTNLKVGARIFVPVVPQ